MRHLYLHIPFCQRRCAYCDFNTYANLGDRIEAYVQALCTELGLLARHHAFAPPISVEAAALRPSIFFGGGTPTMLSLGQLERILTAAAALVPLAEAEITSEANPGTVLQPAYLRGLRALGFNRLSLGVQSLHDPTLRLLGRIHTAAEAHQSYVAAREAGFALLNLDFIFGLPGQDLAQWTTTLATLVHWEVEHLSLYALTLEAPTPLAAQIHAGRIGVPDDDDAATLYEEAMARLAAAGYVQYEISNWVRPAGREVLPGLPWQACHHNLAYWLNSDYMAAGAGAHGHRYPRRYANILGVDAYIKAVGAGHLPTAEELPLTPLDLCAETMLMGMRLNVGVSAAHFAARCGLSLETTYGTALAELVGQGLVERAGERVRLTPRGRMLGNRVFARFV